MSLQHSSSVAALREQLDRPQELTPREVEVMQTLADGHATREVAGKLFLAEETVKGYVKSVIRKRHAKNRTHAIAELLREGTIT